MKLAEIVNIWRKMGRQGEWGEQLSFPPSCWRQGRRASWTRGRGCYTRWEGGCMQNCGANDKSARTKGGVSGWEGQFGHVSWGKC